MLLRVVFCLHTSFRLLVFHDFHHPVTVVPVVLPTMVFTVAQTTNFFLNKIGIPQETYTQLQAEGGTTIDDLGMMNGKAINAIADNLRKPADRIPNPYPGAPVG